MTFTRSGITANLSPTQEFKPATANTVSLVDTFQESTNLIPLASKTPAPGNLVAHLVFTLSSSASPGPSIAITIDPSVTLLSDEGGNTSESPANGTLVLIDGAINIPSQIVTTPIASMAQTPAEPLPSSVKTEQSLRPTRFPNNAKLAAGITRFSPRTSTYTGTTNHDALFGYDEAGDVLHDDTGRTFTYDALSMTTGAIAPFTNGGGTRTFAYIYTADDERIALVEMLPSGATTTNWTLRGLDNHLLRTWTNSSTSGWSWREDDIWRGAPGKRVVHRRPPLRPRPPRLPRHPTARVVIDDRDDRFRRHRPGRSLIRPELTRGELLQECVVDGESLNRIAVGALASRRLARQSLP